MKSGPKTQTQHVRRIILCRNVAAVFHAHFLHAVQASFDRLVAILVFPLPVMPSPPLTHISSRFSIFDFRICGNQKFGTGFCMFVSLRNFSTSCHISIFIKSEAKEIYTKIELCR